jgi:hypothetical protein
MVNAHKAMTNPLRPVLASQPTLENGPKRGFKESFAYNSTFAWQRTPAFLNECKCKNRRK